MRLVQWKDRTAHAGSRAVAAQLVDARLLVADRDQATREPTIEVAHEALLTRWDRLAGWIADDRRWMTQLHHLATAARAWNLATFDATGSHGPAF